MTALMHAYFDESGTHTGGPLRQQPLVMCVAGYLFTEKRVKSFEDRWNSALRQAGLAYFRMSECASGRGQFKGWQESHRQQYAKSMARIVRAHASHGFGVWASEREFDLRAPTYWREHYGSVYTACLFQSIVLIGHWCRWNNYAGEIKYFFESGDKRAGEAGRHMQSATKEARQRAAIRYASHTFVKKGSARGIEAADLLAWHLNKLYNGVLRTGESAEKLMSPILRYLEGPSGLKTSVYSLKGEQLKKWFAAQAPPAGHAADEEVTTR